MTLKDYLLEHDLSSRQFAILINKSHPTVLRWITGETEISLRDSYKVLAVTDGLVCPHDFINEMETRESAH